MKMQLTRLLFQRINKLIQTQFYQISIAEADVLVKENKDARYSEDKMKNEKQEPIRKT